MHVGRPHVHLQRCLERQQRRQVPLLPGRHSVVRTSLPRTPYPPRLTAVSIGYPVTRSGGGFKRGIYFDNGAVAGVAISVVILASVIAGCAYFQYMQKVSREAVEGRRRSVSGSTYQSGISKNQRGIGRPLQPENGTNNNPLASILIWHPPVRRSGQEEIELPRACGGALDSSAV